LTIPLCKLERVQEFTPGLAKTYYIPLDDNFPCIDSWIPNIGFFQMTVAGSHAIKEDGLADVIKPYLLQNFVGKLKYFFVVPDDASFENFNAQNFKTGNSNNSSSSGAKRARKNEDSALYVQHIEQYVLKIDYSQ